MVSRHLIKKIKKFAAALTQEGVTVDKIILYGSYARNKQRPDSDIDVAAVSRNFGKDRVEEGMLLFRIAGKIDPRIEPVPISVESYNNDTWVPLIYEIRTKGIELKAA
jgi:predicted nucleotidyltransferase